MAGNSYSHSGAAAAEGETAPAEESAFDRIAFLTLNEITREIENEGFVHVERRRAGIGRITASFSACFTRRKIARRPTICLNEQHDLSFYYLANFIRAPRAGVIWTTWNYPLSYGLKLTPQFRINRQRPDQSFWQLYQSHRAVSPPKRRDMRTQSMRWMKSGSKRKWKTICAIRSRTTSTKACSNRLPAGDVKYSWRGMIYLWCQFLVDLVRL